MSDASVTVGVRSTGADLRAIAGELRKMDDATVRRLFRERLEAAAKPIVPRGKASVLAIPATGEKHSGLRGRIAACVEVASREPGPRQVSVAVEVNAHRMPDREKGLPLYMEGVGIGRHDRWRHPVYGHSERPWVQQRSHPYFYGPASAFGPAAGRAMQAALEDITRQLGG